MVLMNLHFITGYVNISYAKSTLLNILLLFTALTVVYTKNGKTKNGKQKRMKVAN